MSACPCGMPFPTTEKCRVCGSSVHVYCMQVTRCKWCVESSSGKRKTRQLATVGDEPRNKKAKPTAPSRTTSTEAKTAEVTSKTTPRNERVTRKPSGELSDTESELSDSELELELVETEQKFVAVGSETQTQRFHLLRLKAKVARYQAKAHEFKAKAMEAHYEAETFATRIKLHARGVPANEIDAFLPSL